MWITLLIFAKGGSISSNLILLDEKKPNNFFSIFPSAPMYLDEGKSLFSIKTDRTAPSDKLKVSKRAAKAKAEFEASMVRFQRLYPFWSIDHLPLFCRFKSTRTGTETLFPGCKLSNFLTSTQSGSDKGK